MEEKIIYEMKALYRDNFRIKGYRFGKGEKALCIVGNMRGNEYQQLYICSQLVKRLKKLEEEGKIREGKEILILPSANPYSLNISKRFWPTDNTDINRMLPGYDKGETTQRIADGIFQAVKDYEYGIQFTSFYMPGNFVPHVRIMKTDMQYLEDAKKFGLPYVVLRNPRPYDTTTLNYNWQIWETKAFSVYSSSTEAIDEKSAEESVEAILNFMKEVDILDYNSWAQCRSKVIEDSSLLSVRSKTSGIFQSEVQPGQRVVEGQPLADILDPYLGTIQERIAAPATGTIFFVHGHPLTYSHTAILKIFPADV